MNSKKSKIRLRVLSVLLIAIMVVQLFPIRISFPAEAATDPNAVTFTVTDGTDPINGATVNVFKTGDPTPVFTTNTGVDGVDGVVEISPIDLRDEALEYSYEYEVSKHGYETLPRAPFAISSGSAIDVSSGSGIDVTSGSAITFSGNINVVLIPIPTTTVSGKVSDKDTGTGISKAKVSLSGYSNYSSIETGEDGSFSILNVYGTGVYSMRIEHDDYKTIEMNANLAASNDVMMALKSEQSKLLFEYPFPAAIKFNEVFTNCIKNGGSGNGSISYEVISGFDVATVDNTYGTLETLKAGNVTVRATKASDGEYKPAIAEYTLTINPVNQDDFKFSNQLPIIKYGDSNNIYTNGTLSNGSGNGAISYSIKTGGDCASIDDSTKGTLSIKKAGTVEVVAVKAADGGYNEATATYTLTINKGDQSEFFFGKRTPADIEFSYGLKFSNAVTGGTGKGAITYSVSDATINPITGKIVPIYPITREVATIDPDTGELSILKSGIVEVKATKATDECYNKSDAFYTLKIIQGNQNELKFDISSPQDFTYDPIDNTFVNKATGGSGNGAITYSVKDATFNPITGKVVPNNPITREVATIDTDTGELTISKSGMVEVTATKAAENRYRERSKTYSLKINRAQQTGFAFRDTSSIFNVTYGDNLNSFTNLAIGGQSSKRISYTIEGAAATIDELTGELKIKEAGTVKVTATKAGDDRYESTEKSYTLIIDRADQTGFDFIYTNPDPIVYDENNTSFNTNHATGGQSVGSPYYQIDNGYAATITDKTSHILTIKRAGSVTVKAIKPADNCYNAAEATYTLTVELGNQTDFTFQKPNSEFNITYGTEFSNTASGGQSYSKVNYLIIPNPSGVIESIDQENGALTFNNGGVGTVKIKAIRPDDGRYKAINAEYTLNVSFATVPESPYKLAGDMKNSSGWFTGPVTITPAYGYKISDSNNLTSNTWSDSLVVSTDCDGYTIYLKEISANGITDAIPVKDLKIDQTMASNFLVTYSTSVLDKFLENISFGFYNAPAIVTIEATDITSGVKSFAYRYTVDSDASSINIGTAEDLIVTSDKITYTTDTDGVEKATAKFEIPAQFRGKVSFSATDEAGNVAKYSDGKVVVVDTFAPGVTVEYFNNNAQNGNYYTAERTAKITITEANFFGSDVIIKVGKCLNSQKEYLYTYPSPEFDKNGDVYTKTILFNEDADYTFDIKYTDKSGNVYDSYEEDKFTIDKIKPAIKVTYDNNSAQNDKYYKANRTATITVTEHNFNSALVSGIVTAKDLDNNDIGTDNYAALLTDPANWSSIGDIHTAQIAFSVDGFYTFDIDCNDIAQNAAEDYPKDNFVIDKVIPKNLPVKYSETVPDTILENITFGFYQARISVTISAEDATSGINQFVYSYAVEDGASAKNVGVSNQTVTASAISIDGKVAEASFFIYPQFRGKVSFEATDKAGNVTTKLTDDKVIVVDNVAPGVTVTYDNQNAINGNYYNANRIAKIEVTEANFYEEDVEITVEKKILLESNYTKTRVQPVFTKNKDVYTAQVEFTEDADYTFDIKYTDKSGNVFDSYEIDKFTVDTVKPVIEVSYDNNTLVNGKYYNEERVATITVNEHNFNAADFSTTITAKNFENDAVSVADYAAYLKDPANWTTVGDSHKALIVFSQDAQYTFDVSYTDFAGNEAEDFEKHEFVVDSTIPENMSIKYSTPFFDTLLENVSFGFYNAPVEVTITAEDASAGIDYFTYSYEVENGASTTNTGLIDQKVISDQIDYSNNGKTATISFSIQPQYRGSVAFKAVDRAANWADLVDNKVIVVDDVAPGVTVQYDNQSVLNSSYYKANRTATIIISEANFFDSDVQIVVGKQLDSETSYTESRVKPNFSKNGDTFTAQVLFEENADYTFDIKYTDKSGNIFASYKKDMFTIDKLPPSIKVSYDNNSALNSKMFKDKRTATISISEHNFRAENVIASITAQNADGSNVVINDFVGQLKTPSSWIRSGDTYTAVVTYTEDANYKFDIGYVDLAGNQNSTINYSSSVAPTEFTIDKGLPSGSIHIGKLNETTSEKVWNTFLQTISFGLWTNNEITVTLSSSDALSGIEQIRYFRTDTPMTMTEVQAKSEGWTASSGGNASFTIEPDEQFIVYNYIVDKAGNYIYISSDGVIADSTGPKVETLSPEITATTKEQPKNMIFNKDVTVDIAVVDPMSKNSVYSGLKSITYQVINSGSVTQEGKLYSFDKVAPVKSDLKQQWKGSIVVDSKKNNNNNVMVKITVVDNAENSVTKTLPIKIDITEPTIDIKYDNNSQDSTFNGYFKADRTATVVITERNFNKGDVKLSIANTDGERAIISDWVKVSGTGNNDNTTHTAKIAFVDDGDYTFDITYTDLANNKNNNVDYGNSIAPTSFTIDKTVPVIAVNYSTNNSKNENYFNSRRVATIVITEHNFDTGRIKASMTSSDDGRPAAIPGVSNWTSNGDVHTATINFEKDSLYSLDIEYTDKAGNSAVDFKQQSFYIDNTVPKLTITGVADKSASRGDVIPVVTCSDTNIDIKNMNISLVGANRKSVKLNGTTLNTHNGIVFTFKNFEKIKSVDDVYTLSVNVIDKAGNSSNQRISFSVNRFGSTYTVADTTEKIIGKFIPNEEDIVLTETNVDVLHDIRITMFKDNITKVMLPNKDYTIEEVGGNGMWHQYIYTINKNNFTEDGVYRLIVYSEDRANNKSENTMDTKLTEISFGVDKTEPNIIIADLEDGETYPLNSKPVSMSIKDNLKLESVKVELNGNEIKNWSGKDIEKMIEKRSDFSFEVSGESIQAHNVKIVSADAAGNERITDIKSFYVTTNLWVRFVNNKPVFFGVTGGMTVITVPLTAYAVFRRRKLTIK